MWLQRIYERFWWWSEFFIVDANLKRPFTYIFRDYPAWFFAFIAALGVVAYFSGTWWARVPIITFIGLVTGHVWWGSKIVTGQQENPEYNPS